MTYDRSPNMTKKSQVAGVYLTVRMTDGREVTYPVSPSGVVGDRPRYDTSDDDNYELVYTADQTVSEIIRGGLKDGRR